MIKPQSDEDKQRMLLFLILCGLALPLWRLVNYLKAYFGYPQQGIKLKVTYRLNEVNQLFQVAIIECDDHDSVTEFIRILNHYDQVTIEAIN